MPHQSTTSRQQFVRLCECGCGQPTLLAKETSKRGGVRKGEPLRFLQRHQPRGERNWHWKGGRILDENGYIRLWRPDHPHADGKGYVLEHRAVVEKALGRHLRPGEHVHHCDGNKQNNRRENLQVVSAAEHMRLHACPRWSRKYERCVVCGSTDRPHLAKGRCRLCYQREHRRHLTSQAPVG